MRAAMGILTVVNVLARLHDTCHHAAEARGLAVTYTRGQHVLVRRFLRENLRTFTLNSHLDSTYTLLNRIYDHLS